MATINFPDNTPVTVIKQALASVGKSLQYRPGPSRKPQPEDVPHGHHRRTTHLQPVPGLADQQSNH
ncbi:MAG: hypothetical protein Unbinned8699contig1000_38 [Prokaryotic dsDNA virus sp.]|uniref:hypothetical protein n=1 Tax=Marinobacter sp. MIT932201 TaxID=3096995 RepID=UPI00118D561D|nr:MAG: hypothetical protein Unbinned8699contig1000_38 [Prokaryotic dsDNA virus sp.]